VLATVGSATLIGVEGRPITVEVHVSTGLPQFTVVGLPDASCREARDRVRAAILSSDLTWPQRRVTVNLAPSDVRKAGTSLDLPIAVALLAADGQLDTGSIAGVSFLGELGLDGSLRRITGTLPLVDAVTDGAVVVPLSVSAEASLLRRHRILPATTLRGLVAALRGEAGWPAPERAAPAAPLAEAPDLADVRGQPVGRLAVEIAAAGGHHLLLVGPPGAGKTMLARRLPGLLPPLDRAAAVEVTRIQSAAGMARAGGHSWSDRRCGRLITAPRWSRSSAGGRLVCDPVRSAARTMASSSSTSSASTPRPCSTRCANLSRKVR